jgi:hypothetical protein
MTFPESQIPAADCTVRSPAENHWLKCGVVGDSFVRHRYINASTTFYATIHSEKIVNFTVVLFSKWLCLFWSACKIGVRIIVTPLFCRYLLFYRN